MTDGGQPSWRRIVKEQGRRVFRIAFRILGSTHDAEDVSQEVFAEAYRLHKSQSVQSLTGLLVRLATLRSIDRLRRRRPVESLRDQDAVSAVEPFDELVAGELAQWLRRAIAELPEQQAAVFTLAHFDQLSRSEIAECLEITCEAVSTAMYKARRQLMSQLSSLNQG